MKKKARNKSINRTREISLKDIRISPWDLSKCRQSQIRRLATQMHNGKIFPLPVINETTGNFIGDKAILYAMCRLSYDKVKCLVIRLSCVEEMGIFLSFLK